MLAASQPLSPCLSCHTLPEVPPQSSGLATGLGRFARACSPLCLQGFKIFGALLRWFQKQNNWRGWGIFLAIYCANVALFLPGVVLILGAGFVFG